MAMMGGMGMGGGQVTRTVTMSYGSSVRVHLLITLYFMVNHCMEVFRWLQNVKCQFVLYTLVASC